MNFTITNRVGYDIHWYFDAQIYDQLHDQLHEEVDEEVDDKVRWEVIEQVESQVCAQVYVHNPTKTKIKREIEK